MENSSRFFSNTQCAYFPCHTGADPARFNCLFCYCPLYFLKNCGGHCTWLPSGIKDCSACLVPHWPDNYDAVVKRLSDEIRADEIRGAAPNPVGALPQTPLGGMMPPEPPQCRKTVAPHPFCGSECANVSVNHESLL